MPTANSADSGLRKRGLLRFALCCTAVFALPLPASSQEPAIPMPLVRRIVLIVPPQRAENSTSANRRIELERAHLLKARAKKRRNLFAPPHSSPTKIQPLEPIRSGAAQKNFVKIEKIKKTAAAKIAAANDVIPADQLPAVAQALALDALSEQLKTKMGVEVVSEQETRAALSKLGLTAMQACTGTGAKQIAELLACDAVLSPRLERAEVQENVERSVSVWMEVGIPYLSPIHADVGAPDSSPDASKAKQTGTKSSNGARASAGKSRSRDGKSPITYRVPGGTTNGSTANWRDHFVVAGAASVGHILFRSGYQKSQSALLNEATRQAANLIVHRLRTGESAPFGHDGDRIAFLPVASPSRADLMLFTPSGRRILTGAVSGLPEDVSELFAPDLMPLADADILTAADIRDILQQDGNQTVKPQGKGTLNQRLIRPARSSGFAAFSLRNSTAPPDAQAVQALGKSLRVDFVMIARITDVQIERGVAVSPSDTSVVDSPPSLVGKRLPYEADDVTHAAPSAAQRRAAAVRLTARVEASGTLIRVSDGVTLWQDHGAAMLPANGSPLRPAGKFSPTAEQQVARDAIHFALIDLKLRFRQYRARFER